MTGGFRRFLNKSNISKEYDEDLSLTGIFRVIT
jgi:hypothetical protein